ncbi:MAG: choice-of-anchor O protein [Planctomycetota bacterium]
MKISPLFAGLTAGLCATTSFAQEQFQFRATQVLSEEVPGGPQLGEDSDKAKMVRLNQTPGGALDGRLVVVYADAESAEMVWTPRGGTHATHDIFSRYSDDGGDTWSAPLNISNTAAHPSASTDWNGDGIAEPYYGDSEKPNIFNNGNTIVVSWVDAYVPEEGVAWGSDSISSVQGSVVYSDATVYPHVREVPFKTVYVAISYDGGATFEYGQTQPPLQMTRGRRDAKQDVHRGAGKRWTITWQEDPMGLQQGNADGPGDGASGATVTKGTDIWYSYTSDITVDPLALVNHRAPISNQSEYDRTATNGFPLNPTGGGGASGTNSHPDAGSIENHGCSRPNLGMVNSGGTIYAMVSYEESKGDPAVANGKTVQYHAFPFDAPPLSGTPDHAYGSAGTRLSRLDSNARRVRFVFQTISATNPGLAIFWRQGTNTEGAPADILCKVASDVDEATVLAAPALNLSTNCPYATMADLLLDTEVDPLEDANAHRAYIRDNLVVVGWGYTFNGPLARYTDLANYDFWIRRSLDGGVTWEAPRNVSRITDTTVTMREPRLVGPAKLPGSDANSFVVAWGTERNVYEGLATPYPLDAMFAHTRDQGATFSKVVPIAAGVPRGEYESQIRIDDTVQEVYAVVMADDGVTSETLYTRAIALDLPPTVGTIVCMGDGTGEACPCGNSGGLGEGCSHGGGHGAQLLAGGSASLAAADLALEVTGLPPTTFAVMTTGPNYAATSTGAPAGDGLLCIGYPLMRLGVLIADGSGALQTGLPMGVSLQPGQTWLFQLFYRDHGGPCGTGFNVSNGLAVEFGL